MVKTTTSPKKGKAGVAGSSPATLKALIRLLGSLKPISVPLSLRP